MDTMIEHFWHVIVPERKPIQLTDVVPDLTGTPKIDLLPSARRKRYNRYHRGQDG
jgi:hypothetical protein